MIPRRLRLRNFMSYGDEPVELDFDGLHLACLSGGNGHGKSALLDAITWVLWGRSRARREDDLVYHGATEMEVEFEFAVGGGRYRVVRKRTVRKSGAAALELQVLGDSGQTALTGGTMTETQARIVEILKLGYETFINSTLLLQGRADEFTVKAPAQRKAVLGEILGLEEYDRLAERARERGRLLAARASSIRDGIAAAEEDLARRPGLRAEQATLEETRAAATAAVHVAERALWAVRDERRQLEADERALEEVQRSIVALHGEMERLGRRRDEAEAAIRAAERLLENEERITAGVAELRHVREDLAALGARAAQHHACERAVEAIRHEIHLAEEGLRAEIRTAQAEAAGCARLAEAAPALRRSVAEYAGSEERIPAVEAQRAEVAVALDAARDEIAGLQQANAALEGEMKPLRERLKLLQEPGAACPVCDKPMGETERQRIKKQYTDDGVARGKQVQGNEARVAALSERIAILQGQDRDLAVTLAGLHKSARDLGGARQRLQAAEEAQESERVARARAATAERTLHDAAFAPEARQRLAAAEEALAAVGYDAARHAALRRQEQDLVPLEAQVAQVATARERHSNARAIVVTVEGDLERRSEEVARAEESVARLRGVLAAVPRIEARQTACEADLAAGRTREDAAKRRLAALAELLRGLDEQEERVQVRRAELAAVEQEGDAYAELGRIFGRAGIQAMIIDNALPELERGANAILSRMSDNSMQVQFATQAQGVKKDVLETLDIRIADANGTRPYEMFSGGEAFRVNFAIRIALSRLLAERAGAQLQMLVIDEGFGTQDAQGRERLVEAINSVAADFQKIIVVTHIDELKDLFSTRIEVIKGIDGSRLIVTAA